MQAIPRQRSTAASVIVFPTRMSTPATTPQQPEETGGSVVWSPPRHGNLAQIIAAAIAVIALLVSVGGLIFTVSTRQQDVNTKTGDEHTNGLIESKLKPEIRSVNDGIDKKLEPINDKLNILIA